VSTLGIASGSRLLLDTSAFIYYLDAHPVYEGRAREIVAGIQAGRFSGFASALVLSELLVPYFKAGDERRAAELREAVTSSANLRVVPAGAQISTEAARLRARFGLRTPDAVHAATALHSNADVFVTNDARLRRLREVGLDVWLFDEHL
jgi:predicted nucleic acid-binding protein